MKMRLLKAFAILMPLLLTVEARAHFVWVVASPEPAGSRAEIYFSETADPGAARLIDKIAPLTKAWAVAADGLSQPFTLEKLVSGDNAKLTGTAPASAIIAASCNYGVFAREGTPRLLRYYAKHVGRDAPAFAPANGLPLDILTGSEGKTLSCEVRWQDKPAVDVPVVVTNPDGSEQELRTDGAGRVQLRDAIPGDYAIRATLVEKQHGEEADKHYDEIWTITTLTLKLADAAAATTTQTLDANQLLQQARSARAVWNDFPGFNAKVSIRVDEHVHRGGISVDPHGEVKLHDVEGSGIAWASQQLLSMMRHRMPAPFSDSPVAYVEETEEHPLGRLVKFSDESLHSTYRINGDVITEVHRTTGDSRFTITTLDVWRNPEGNYVPQDFVASFWNAQTGELVSNEAVHDTWQRVGAFDLPLRHIVVKTSSRGRQVMQIDFSDFELLPAPKATAIR